MSQISTLASKFKTFFTTGEVSAVLGTKFFYIVLVNSLTFHSLSFGDDFIEFAERYMKNFFWNFGSFFIIFSFCLFLKAKLYQVLLNVLFWLTFIIGAVNIFLLINFNFTLNAAAISTFFATNMRETGEFLNLYVYDNQTTLIVLALFIIISVAVFRVKRSFEFSRRIHLVLALIILFFVSDNYKRWGVLHQMQKTALFFAVGGIHFEIKEQQNALAELAKSKDEINAMLKDKITQSAGGGGLQYISQSKQIPKIVLIIGESTQRNYMQIYGYGLPTTPHLAELVKSQNLFIFDDVISSSTATSINLMRILTFANVENGATPWYKQMNLVDAMKLLGYSTAFLSTQEPMSLYGNAQQSIALHADFYDYGSLHKFAKKRDERLLEMYDGLKTQQKPSQMLIFHLMGTHTSYKVRYPDEFAKFGIDDLRENGLDSFTSGAKKGQSLNFKQARNRARYLNAILYNDFVVSELMKRFADDESIVLYLSDHGDEVYDTRNFAGHGEPNRYSLEIPFIIYMSDTFKARHPDIVTKVQKAQHKPFMSDNLMHALFDLLDIECVELDKTLSLFSDEFNDKRVRLIDGKDYDKDLKSVK